MFYNARWYDSSIGRFAQADTDVPASQGVQAYDRYAAMSNNPVRYTDPSGHRATCDVDENCKLAQQLTHLKGVNYWKTAIKGDFGVTLKDGGTEHQYFIDTRGNPTSKGRDWNEKNASLVYFGLSTMNGIKSIAGSLTFTLNTHPDANHYFGYTTPGNVDFYNTTTIPLQNLYHEFGHVLNNVAGDTYTTALGASVHRSGAGDYWFGGNGAGTLNPNLVFKSGSVSDPNYGSVGALQHNDGTSNEQWADIWANYVAGNIDTSLAGGSAMYDWITKQLNP